MKAGAALGLLAGLGALNALGGGRNGTGKRFTGLMDMLDGGGAGASGDRFEGGGLLSILGNLFAKPLEAQDNVERIAADTNATRAVTEVLKNQIVPTYGAAEGIAATNRAMDMPYNQSFTPPYIPPVTSDPRNFQQGTEPSMLTEAQKEAIVMGQVIPPAVFDPRNFQQGTEPSTLTEAQKEAIVMGQVIPPAVFDPRNFQQGTEPSTLTESQRMRAAGILAGQAAMAPVTQSQLQGGAESEAPNAYGFSVMSGYGDKSPEAPVAPDPMGLLPRQTMTPPAATNMDAPSVSALLDVPSTSPNEAQAMLQSLSQTIPQRAMESDPVIVQGYKDYVISGGTDDYSTYYRSRPEYQAERQLFAETGGTLFDLPETERKRLIAERADIIRREASKPMPFTGPAF